jgi:hypothetical protein
MKYLFTSIILIFLLGCTGAEVKRGAVMEKGVNFTTAPKTIDISQPLIAPNAINVTQTQPFVKVDPNAIHVEKDAVNIVQTQPFVKVEPNSVHVEQGAFQFMIQSGAITVQEGAIQISLGQKPPPIAKPDTKGIREIKDVDVVKGVADKKLAEDIINNEVIYKAIIEALMQRIDIYNKNYAAPPEKK